MSRLSGVVVIVLVTSTVTIVSATAIDPAIEPAIEPGVRPMAVQALTSGMPSVAVSGDGRYIAFESRAALTEDDVSPAVDIYVLDRATGSITLESAPVKPGGASGDSGRPRLSADGRFLVFVSGADLMRTSDPESDKFPRIYLRDRQRGTLRCLSVAPNGGPANGGSSEPAISASGNIVAFTSQATNLLAGRDANDGNGASSDIFLWRADTQSLSRLDLDTVGVADERGPVASASAGAPRIVAAYEPSLSADGQTIAFSVILDRLESADDVPAKRGIARRRATQVYVKELRDAGGTLERVGCATFNGCERGRDFRPAISADGHFVAFVSTAPDRVKQDTNLVSDVFLFDRRTHETTLVSRTPSGRSGNDLSSLPAISADGHFITFESRASNLVCERRCSEADADRNLVSDIFLFDRATGSMTRISTTGEPWWDASVGPAIDDEGSVIAFSSARARGPDDWRGDFDLFAWESRPMTLRVPRAPTQAAAGWSYNAPADAPPVDRLR